MRDFSSMLLDGKLTEVKMARYFMGRGYEVIDRSDDVEYQDKDIDFEIRMPGQLFGIEVKSDRRISETGNILIEDGMTRESGYYPGWYHKCEADILCYHDELRDEGYMLDWKRVQREVTQHFNRKTFYNRYDNCDGHIYLVPVSEAIRLGWVIECYKIP